eukprot:1146837-Pelagomonas_calceolata.AAC.2
MIAVSWEMYCNYANVGDWCVQDKKALETCYKKAQIAAITWTAYAAFIDFSQAYDTVPRLQCWDHLQCIATPAPLLWEIKEMYQDDECFLIDGDKRARVH